MLPDFKRADWIGEFLGYPESQAFAELLIDCEGGPDASGGAVGTLREATRPLGTPGARAARRAEA
jgi:hypothetical protein